MELNKPIFTQIIETSRPHPAEYYIIDFIQLLSREHSSCIFYLYQEGSHSILPKGCMTQFRSSDIVLLCLGDYDVIATVHHHLKQAQEPI